MEFISGVLTKSCYRLFKSKPFPAANPAERGRRTATVKFAVMLYPLIRKFFFALDAETAHGIGMMGVDRVACLMANRSHHAGRRHGPQVPQSGRPRRRPGQERRPHRRSGGLGFGFIEIGTITPRPQDGNPKPRLFRIPEAQGIINRMGFNNAGVDALLENVRAAKFPKKGGILGINIGKNADTPIEAADDYLICLDKVYHPRRQLRHRQHLVANTRTCASCRGRGARRPARPAQGPRPGNSPTSTANTCRWR